jgi:AcrR family transcriptional regulator
VVQPEPGAAPARRSRRPSLSNDEFLQKALDMFIESGFERTSIEAITAAAGIAKKTVYARYGDKISLFKAALRRAIDGWLISTDQLQALETDDLEMTLLAIGNALVDNILKPTGILLMRITSTDAWRIPDMGDYMVHEGSDGTMAYLADVFRRYLGEDQVSEREAADAAEAFLHLVVAGPANTGMWGMARTEEAINRRVKYSVNLFLNGLLARAGAPNAGEEMPRLQSELAQIKGRVADAAQQLDSVRAALSEIDTVRTGPKPKR